MTKYYAAEPDRISQDSIQDGIEITKEQYLEALEMLIDPNDNRVISTLNGVFALVDIVEEVPEEPEEPEINLYDYSATKRWQKEVNGFMWNGILVPSDDRSKILISGARQAADNDPEFTTKWKLANGAFVVLDADALVSLSDAALQHVSLCFALEAEVSGLIESGEITTKEQVDQAYDR